MATSGERLFVLLQIRGELFALPAEQVRAVTPVGKITRIPYAPREVRGAASWRGKVLTLCDLGESLGLPGHASDGPYAIVLDPLDRDFDVGILAEEVRGIRAIPEDLLSSLRSNGRRSHGVIDLDDLPVMVLDPTPLIDRLETAVLSLTSP
ncbi:MAG: chemotaxis protein CheW [Candidatus Methylomirabilales bacterium]